MKLTRRNFLKALGGGALAAVVPSALLKQEAAAFVTKDKVFRVTERWPEGFGLVPIKQEGTKIVYDDYLCDPDTWFLKKEGEEDIVWTDNRSFYGVMAE